MNNTRTENTLKNIISTIIPFVIIGLLGIFRTRVFLLNLSDGIVSINQLFYQLFSYISIVEAGFGIFIVYKYYDALVKNQKKKINSLYSTSIIYFRRIAYVTIAISFALSFFAHNFTKADLSNLYIQIVFLVFILKNSIDYFMISPRLVIQADQKMYKINYVVNGIKVLEYTVEIFLAMMGIDYLFILIPGIIIRIILNIIINKRVQKEYPWLKNNNIYDSSHIKGMKDLITQKLAGIFKTNTDIILISTFINPISVVMYSSYLFIIKFVQDIIYNLSIAISSSYANVLKSKSEKERYSLYCELSILFYSIATTMTVFLYKVTNQFIVLWIGEKYLFDNLSYIFLLVCLFFEISKRMIYLTINSEGIFKETKNIIVLESIINLVVSVLLVFKYGIKGVLFGTVISTLLTTLSHLPRKYYKILFGKSIKEYYYMLMSSSVITFILVITFSRINISFGGGLFNWLLSSIIYFILIVSIVVAIYYFSFNSFRRLISRGIYVQRVKRNQKNK